MRASTSLARRLSPLGRIASQPLASALRPRLATAAAATATRAIVTIPHPSLNVEGGQTRFAIKMFDHLPSLTDSLAVLRAVEAQLGPVIKVDVPKDTSTMRATNLIFVTLLKPVVLDKPLSLEIPAPTLSTESTHLGGVALKDVLAALHPAAGDSKATKSNTAQPLRFRIEARTSEGKNRQWRQFGARVTRTPHEVQEDDRIVRALREFDGGFYGGFGGVAEQFKSFVNERDVALVEEAAVVEDPEAALEEEQAAEAVAAAKAARKAAKAAALAETAPAAPRSRSSKTKEQKAQAQAKSREEKMRDKALQAALLELKLEREATAAAAETEASAAPEEKEAEVAAQLEPAAQEQEPPTAQKGAWRWLPGRK
ncbi:hypothetical protein VHUM_02964 [Vanrija humicola]|uniref:Uncharacterized protein n=1 Tax=Vanrija humicola TaxID=5417 RepID=A0A7D8V128_VANHU|nr:hypothetical protein VHUM_02964 [Vanrija humicola]